MQTSILYYTNNLLSSNLLTNTLQSALNHAVKNDCELIITSHEPIMMYHSFEPLVDKPFYASSVDPANGKTEKSKLYDHIVSGNLLQTDYPHVKNYVVGKLPYSLLSIMRQILFSIERSGGDNVILMEHDCFYPSDYVKVMESKFPNNEMIFSEGATCFLDRNGFYARNPTCFLSTFAGRKSLFRAIFERKISLAQKGERFILEPLVGEPEDYISYSLTDILMKEYLCLGESDFEGVILDVRHNFNSANIDKVSVEKHFQEHKYWGNANKYIDMISGLNIDDCNSKMWSHGLVNMDF